MIAIIFEDRTSDLIAVKLLLLSMRQHSPWLPAVVACPSADSAFADWVRALGPAYVLRTDLKGDLGSWDAKPSLLKQMLLEGHDRVVWMDSDLLLTRDIRALFTPGSSDEIISTEEPWASANRTAAERALGHGFKLGRAIPTTLNTSILSVSHAHMELLDAWDLILHSKPYRDAQSLPILSRPIHLFTDQDVMSALLCSERFSGIPLRQLRDGIDIAHCLGLDGFRAIHRVRAAFCGVPSIIHAQGRKPWRGDPNARPLHLDVSPYASLSRDYATGLPSMDCVAWMEPKTFLGRALSAICFRSPTLPGVLPALPQEFARRIRFRTRLRKLGR